jgi:hypothetical protein
LAWLTGPAASQSAQGDAYHSRMTQALSAAKRSAEQLNDQQKTLLNAIDQAADPQQAQRSLDDLIGTSLSALTPFTESSEVMSAIGDVLTHIEQRRRNAEEKAATDPRWIERANVWKAYGDNFRQLRQDLLKEADRAGNLLHQLVNDRSLIEDILASEGVDRAKSEMQAALKNLRELGDALAKAITVAEERNRKINAPAL